MKGDIIKMAERTLVLIKPDAVSEHHTGDIIKMYESEGLTILALKMLDMDVKLAHQHYFEHINKPYFPELLDFMQSGPIVAMVLEGDDAIAKVRKINGSTDPKEAAEGTIRKLYAESKTYNAVHGSDSKESAAREISIFFNSQEIMD